MSGLVNNPGIMAYNKNLLSDTNAKTIIRTTKQVSPNIPQGIYSGRGGAFSAVKQVKRVSDLQKQMYGQMFGMRGKIKSSLPNFPKDKSSREAVGRIFGLHESAELKVKPGQYGPVAGHLSPSVLARESNIVSSLPKELAPAKRYMRRLRSGTGESKMMKQYSPNFRYGGGRVSKGEVDMMSRISTRNLTRKLEKAEPVRTFFNKLTKRVSKFRPKRFWK